MELMAISTDRSVSNTRGDRTDTGSAGGALQRHVGKLRCVNCGAALDSLASTLRCRSCGREFPVEQGVPILTDQAERTTQSAAGHAESLFRFPSAYELKHDLLERLNPTSPIDLTEYLRGADILDVGCGPFSYGYDMTLPASIVGLDVSPQFAQASARRYPDNLYLVASGRRIPFADKTFDAALLRFVIHHVPGDIAALLREITRVTRRHLVIFDHVRSDTTWKRAIQTTYWRMFDSGHHYNTVSEWENLLAPYAVARSQRSGRMFGNVCHLVLNVEGDCAEARAPLFR